MSFVVKVIGCSTTWSNMPNSSYCIDDKILVDCGEGTTKSYSKCGVNFFDITDIFITHLHSDHASGLSSYLAHMCVYNKDKEKHLTIYGPKGLRRQLDILKIISFGEEDAKKFNLSDYINIVELEGNTCFKFDKYIVSVYETKHGNLTNLAYIFKKDDMTIGFSGDCTYHTNLEEFAANSKVCFLECCDEKTTKFHLGFDKFVELKNKYPKNRFLAIHCVDRLYNNDKYNIEFAISGKTYEF